MDNRTIFWQNVDSIINIHSEYILTDEQIKLISAEEQKAYKENILEIQQILEEFKRELEARGFWTELQANEEGLRFRYSKRGYFGPAGFSSQFHIAGPLVLGEINPRGDQYASYYKTNLDENVQIGCNFDKGTFVDFIKQNINDFLSPNNLIINKEQYDNLRSFSFNN